MDNKLINSNLPTVDDDIFDDLDILNPDSEEPLWDKLIQNIIDGKVIPVIGPEMLTINGKDINSFIIGGLARRIGMTTEPHSFSELIYSPEYKNMIGNLEQIYYQVNNLFSKKIFPATPMLKRFLAIRQFPFIITTSYAPIVEQTMSEIWKDELRVMCFNNNPSENDDIKTGTDLRKPTVYYMFGKVCNGAKKYVLTDTDMLDYVSAWLSGDNKARPKNLCNELKDKYLLMLGNNYSNWLFRFIWYSMRKSNLGQGMLAYDTLDEMLINFLERTETFTKQNTADVIDQIISRLEKKIRENEKTKFNKPEEDTDIFISYSRQDSTIAEKLYTALTAQGKRVWYDRNNLTDGSNFMDEIKKAIRTSKYFIPILTPNITKEKDDSHVYRNEWDTAIEVAISMGRTFIIPLAVNGFDFYKAAIPDKLQQHNALFFSDQDDVDSVANRIIHKMNQD
ncbi:MAG: toll/interleukin-1 receptor domain-containing protein [Clostridiales bacterium]|nr:toll/interleukin-1 receptor domain-containing protein [Clostridiales bacterium]